MSWGVFDYPEPNPESPTPTCPICGAECRYFYRKLFSDEILGCDDCIEREYASDY